MEKLKTKLKNQMQQNLSRCNVTDVRGLLITIFVWHVLLVGVLLSFNEPAMAQEQFTLKQVLS
ncbi:MAG TPA: hypothetical protein VK982_11405, partial [Bacteroidales bacterium]|nr:hypothetical protein [Bacteroidales bacterium]